MGLSCISGTWFPLTFGFLLWILVSLSDVFFPQESAQQLKDYIFYLEVQEREGFPFPSSSNTTHTLILLVICITSLSIRAFQVEQWSRTHLPVQETQDLRPSRVQSLGREAPLEKEMAEEPGGLQSVGPQKGWVQLSSHPHTCESESRSVVSDFLRPHGLYSPWNSPGQNTGVGSLSLLQGFFPTQGPNPGLPHCGQILYKLSHKGSQYSRMLVAKPITVARGDG